MNKHKKIQLTTLGLLLIYLFSMVPVVLIHHHDHQIVSLSNADSCEKAVYYGIQDKHKEHYSKVQDKCLICDHHTAAPQLLFDNPFSFSVPFFHAEYNCTYKDIHSVELIGSYNKGPPIS